MSSIGPTPPVTLNKNTLAVKQDSNPKTSTDKQSRERASPSSKRGTLMGFVNQFRPDLTAAQRKDQLGPAKERPNFLNGIEPRVAVVDKFSRNAYSHGAQVVDVLETQVKQVQITQFNRHTLKIGDFSNALDDVLREAEANGPFDYVNLSTFNDADPRILADRYNNHYKDDPKHVDIGSSFKDWSEEERKSLLNFITTELAENIEAHKEVFLKSNGSTRVDKALAPIRFSALKELSQEMRDARKLMDMGTTIVTGAGNSKTYWGALSLLTSLNGESKGKAYNVAANTQTVFQTTENSLVDKTNPRDGVADYSSTNHANAKAGGYTPEEDFGEKSQGFGTSFSAPDFIANDIATRTGQSTPLPESERQAFLGPSDHKTINTFSAAEPNDAAKPSIDKKPDEIEDDIGDEFDDFGESLESIGIGTQK